MTPRKGESREDYQTRRAAYDATRWRQKQRTMDGDGNLKSLVEVATGRDPADAPPIGTPVATSTLYNNEGQVTAQWIKTRPVQQDPREILLLLRDELTNSVPRIAPFECWSGQRAENLATWYRVGDHHMGMLSWRPETGASYDLSIGEALLTKAFQRLVAVTPKCDTGGIYFSGDFAHYDSQQPVTPKNRNLLDADSRWRKMVRAVIRVMRTQIDMVALWHKTVHIEIMPGNHDPFLMTVLAEALAVYYEKNPRIIINTDASPYHYHRFGNCLIGFTHGDLCKPEKLPGIMTVDRAKDWGETQHRFWWTGHTHQEVARDFPGVSWESCRILPPVDAWAHGAGYRSTRGMSAVVLDHEFGWQSRHDVNPAMLEHT